MGYFEIHIPRLLLGFVVALSRLTLSGEVITSAPVPVHDGGDVFQSMVMAIPAIAQKAGQSWMRPELSIDGRRKSERRRGGIRARMPSSDVLPYSGKRCVPLRCPGGNKQRNKITGECKPEDKEDHYRPLSLTVWHGQDRGQFRHQPAIRGRKIYANRPINWKLKRVETHQRPMDKPRLLETILY